MTERKINLTKKSLREFTVDDTLYIQKLERDYVSLYLCEFIGLKRGVVAARVIEALNFSGVSPGSLITTRPLSCYLWGHTEGEEVAGKPHYRCHWFENTQEPAK